MNDPLVIFHATCWDGFCAAWLVWRALGRPEYERLDGGRIRTECGEFVPIQYGDSVSSADIDGRDVLVVDFSFKRSVMERMRGLARSLVVLDHHKTAEAELVGLPYCHFDMNRSGAQMTWDWLRDGGMFEPGRGADPKPWQVDYVADRDLWRWKLPRSKEINASFRIHPLDFDVWDEIERADPWIHASEGTVVLIAEDAIVDLLVPMAREVGIGGHRVLAVNASVPNLYSEIAGQLAEGRPFGATWFVRPGPNGLVAQWSLRSSEDGIDVSEVAKQHGGGGHRNAAGFEEGLDSLVSRLGSGEAGA